jgi:Acetyltransferase (GNAT) domain
MSSLRAANAVDHKVSRVAVDEQVQTPDALDFQMVRASRCPAHIVQEITSFLDTQTTSHPFQFPQWATDTRTYLALVRRQAKLRWFAQCGVFYPAGRILWPIRALTLNRGPVCDDLDLAEIGLRRLVEAGSREGFAFIDIAPEWTGDVAEAARGFLAHNGWQPFSTPRSSLRMDLSLGLDQLLGNFRKVTRYEIKRSERHEVEVVMARDEKDYDHWLALYREMAKEKQFAAEDCGHIRHVLRWLGAQTQRGGLLLAHKDGRLLGGIVIVRSGVRCWYVFGATSKDDKFSAGHLLQWRAIQWAKEQGCMEYDFSGGEYREGADSGPAFFKRGFCDDVVHFLPPHRQVISGTRVRVSEMVSKFRARLRIS